MLLFIPNESVWQFIHERDPQLIDVALRQKVVLCSPVSLFAVLAVIRQAVEQTQLARTSDEILQCLAGFGKQWTKFAEALDKVVARFDTAQRGLEDLTGPRRRQLERQLDRVEALRAARGLPEGGRPPSATVTRRPAGAPAATCASGTSPKRAESGRDGGLGRRRLALRWPHPSLGVRGSHDPTSLPSGSATIA